MSIIIPGNENVKLIENKLMDSGFFIKAILSPTVAQGKERLRICIHDFNNESQLISLAKKINSLI